jgi:hypothetical protein
MLADLSCKIRIGQLGFTERCTAVGSTRAAIGSYGGWNDQGAQEKCGGGEEHEGTFHGCFLLVTANWTVIFSCR